jgi:hypothetical protein
MAPIIPTSSSAILSLVADIKDVIQSHYILVIFAAVLLRLVYLRYLSPYRDIPGPFLATISPLWKLRGALNGTLHTDITEIHRKYGTIVRIAPDEVSIADPEAIRIIYGHGSGFTKVHTCLWV